MITCFCVLAGKLSTDDLNALIAHAHRRIDQLNRELAEQKVREKIHIDAALQQQKLEDQKALDNAVNTALQHVKEDARLDQERKVQEKISLDCSGFSVNVSVSKTCYDFLCVYAAG